MVLRNRTDCLLRDAVLYPQVSGEEVFVNGKPSAGRNATAVIE